MRIVLSTIAPASAADLAAQLVERRLAACVNVIPGVTSIYRWEGAVQRDDESLLVIKTSDETLSRLMQELPALHPYDVPEIVTLEPSVVHDAYAAWVNTESRRVKDD